MSPAVLLAVALLGQDAYQPKAGDDALVYYQQFPSGLVSTDPRSHHEMAVAILADDVPKLQQLTASKAVIDLPARTKVRIEAVKEVPGAPNVIEAHYSECVVTSGPFLGRNVLVHNVSLHRPDEVPPPVKPRDPAPARPARDLNASSHRAGNLHLGNAGSSAAYGVRNAMRSGGEGYGPSRRFDLVSKSRQSD